ncbi:MAG: hypothetical protein H6595_04770 [Flavobacteriales bacterium]|nr:hypothetical protein [Flavobacteriales bacterium]MCB9166774.1 hypothetical protein [Flavobacteriales bacterium]
MQQQARVRLDLLAAAGLATGALFGVGGSLMHTPVWREFLYEISSVGLVVGAALLTVRYLMAGDAAAAAGFLVLAIGEAVMSGGTVAEPGAARASFGAGMALYVPALVLVGLSRSFPLWVRIVGVLAGAPFLLAAAKIFLDGPVFSTDALPGAGYGLLTLTIVGWIATILRRTPVKDNG